MFRIETERTGDEIYRPETEWRADDLRRFERQRKRSDAICADLLGSGSESNRYDQSCKGMDRIGYVPYRNGKDVLRPDK